MRACGTASWRDQPRVRGGRQRVGRAARLTTEHPRRRGEQRGRGGCRRASRGTTPPARGAARPRLRRDARDGTNPAGAGRARSYSTITKDPWPPRPSESIRPRCTSPVAYSEATNRTPSIASMFASTNDCRSRSNPTFGTGSSTARPADRRKTRISATPTASSPPEGPQHTILDSAPQPPPMG